MFENSFSVKIDTEMYSFVSFLYNIEFLVLGRDLVLRQTEKSFLSVFL